MKESEEAGGRHKRITIYKNEESLYDWMAPLELKIYFRPNILLYLVHIDPGLLVHPTRFPEKAMIRKKIAQSGQLIACKSTFFLLSEC